MKKNVSEEKETVTLPMKTMKMASEVENFYRFIHENKLRTEAHQLLSMVIAPLKKKSKRSRSKAKKLQ